MKCGKPVSRMEQEYCMDCASTEHIFDQGSAPFTYTGRMRQLVYQLKASNRREHLDFFAEAMAQKVRQHQKYWRPDVITAVPMHRSKLRKRGYNQSELLARRISTLTGIPYDPDLIRCIKKAKNQKTLDKRERRNNLKGCFRVEKILPPGMHILVIDDVYTTGSTMDEISLALKKAGAKCVFFTVLCTGKGKNTVCTEQNL